MTGVLIRRRNIDTDRYRRKIIGRHREKTVIYKPRTQDSEEINPAFR